MMSASDEFDAFLGPPDPAETELARLRAALGDRFRIDDALATHLGRTVYPGFDKQTKRDIMVKVLAFDPARYHEVADRLEQLLRGASELGHRTIAAPTHMAVMEGALLYITLSEPGGSVARMLTSVDPVALADVQRIVGEAAEALSLAHAKGLVHGALTPDNILFGANGRARVADFGISDTLEAAGLISAVGAAREHAFAAPEQWRGQRVDSRTDQYSLAVIAYELLTGHRRLDRSGAGGVRTLQPIDVDAHATLGRGIPLYVNTALRTALSVNPANRYATITEFADAFSGRAPLPEKGLPTHRSDIGLPKRWSVVPVLTAFLVVSGAIVAINPESRQRVQGAWNGIWERYAPPQVKVDASLSLDPGAGSPASAPPRTSSAGASGVPGGTASSSVAPAGQTSTPRSTSSTPTGSSSGAGAEPTSTGRSGPEIRVGLGRSALEPGAAAANPAANPSSLDPAKASATATAKGLAHSWMAKLKSTVLGFTSSAPASAYLRVEVDRGTALVTIDGIPRGATPLVATVGAGHHIVGVTGTSSYDPPSAGVNAAGGDTAQLSFRAVSGR